MIGAGKDYSWNTTAQTVGSHRKEIDRWLCMDRERLNQLSRLTTDWPIAEQIRRQVCEFVTCGIEHQEAPILGSTLLAALDVYMNSDLDKHDPERLEQFVEAWAGEMAIHLHGLRARWQFEDGQRGIWKPYEVGNLSEPVGDRRLHRLDLFLVTSPDLEELDFVMERLRKKAIAGSPLADKA